MTAKTINTSASLRDALLTISDLSVSLPKGTDRPYAIEEVSLTLRPREVLCVVGETGSGKSVTSHSILGLLPPMLEITGGSIVFDGEQLQNASAASFRRIRGRRIAMIFQEASSALNPVRTVGDQISEMILAHENVPARKLQERVVASLTEVKLPNPEDLQHTYPFRLSGGQQQRVMIAMALAHSPDLLIADEPTTALDVTTQAQILQLIDSLRQQRGMAVLFVTHDMGVVAEIADRIVVMRRGRIVEQGERDQVLLDPKADYTRQLIDSVPRLNLVTRPAKSGELALEARQLNKTYPAHGIGLFRRAAAVTALNDVSFELRRGETLGVVGESGSGKSTLARCLMRLTSLDSGEFNLGNVPFSELGPDALIKERHRVQMVFQDPYASLNPRQRVETIIGTGLRLKGLGNQEARRRTAEMLDLVGLQKSAIERYPHEFSGGQRQRIAIARALVLEPEVLIADEAVSALDVSVQAQVLDLLAELKDRLDIAMLFITHDLLVAAQVCDRIIVVKDGNIVEQGVTSEVFSRPNHEYTQKLLQAIPGRDWLMHPGGVVTRLNDNPAR